MASLSRAVEAGCTWVEVDVALWRGKLVLYHDMASHHLKKAKKKPLPLASALEWLKVRPKLTMILDLKCMAIHEKLYAKTLVQALLPYKSLNNRLVLTSFHHGLLQALHRPLPTPEWTYGAIVEAALVDLEDYLTSKLGFCSYAMLSHHVFSKATLKALANDFLTGVYTVNNPAIWPLLRDLGADFVFRDF